MTNRELQVVAVFLALSALCFYWGGVMNYAIIIAGNGIQPYLSQDVFEYQDSAEDRAKELLAIHGSQGWGYTVVKLMPVSAFICDLRGK